MTEHPAPEVAQWLAANDEYLARSLTWLRLMLQRAAAHEPASPQVTGPVAEPVPEAVAEPVPAVEPGSSVAVIQVPALPVPASRRWRACQRRRITPLDAQPVTAVITSVAQTAPLAPAPP